MTLVQLEVFRRIVEMKSFSKAAEMLNLTQPAVSHAIKELEKSVGFKLLERHKKGVLLTGDGEEIYEYTTDILNSYEILNQKINQIKGVESGTLRIGTFTSVSISLLPEIIHTFSSRFPNIDLLFFEGDYDQITTWVAEGTVDVGFVPVPTKLKSIPIKTDVLKLVISNDNPLAKKKEISIKDIHEMPFIMPVAGCEFQIEELCKKHMVKPTILYRFEDNHVIMSMVEKNLGISLIPDSCTNSHFNITYMDLVENPSRTIAIAFRDTANLSPAGKEFIRLLEFNH